MNKLYLIPTPIAEDRVANTAADVASIAIAIRYYVVEHIKTARRFLKAIDKTVDIDAIEFFEIDRGFDQRALEAFLSASIAKGHVGLMSEAGCPAVADPGHQAVAWCHRQGVTVEPLVGPSSILLSLMASGFSGQNFAFVGYLPAKKPELAQALKSLYQAVLKQKQTQIFIETPYRNQAMIETVVATLPDDARLCVAVDLDSPEQSVINKTVKQWRASDLAHYHKRPAIFLLGVFS